MKASPRPIRINPWMASTFGLIVILISILLFGPTKTGVPISGESSSPLGSATSAVSAEEIYPLFICPCCGRPLDKDNICCGMAKEMIDYIDSLISQNLSEKEVILSYVKKYGLASFADKNKAQEFKDELAKTAPADRPIISLSPDSYDFGEVSQKKGKVFTSFTLKNEGKSDLVISKLDSSCGCTFAAIVFEGSQSPFFTMPGHGSENPSWEGVTIPSGKEAELKVMYDPDVHQDFRGAATREIYVYSNDPINFEIKVTVDLNQVD